MFHFQEITLKNFMEFLIPALLSYLGGFYHGKNK